MKSYGQVLDSIEALPENQQESLMEVVRKRLLERRRNALAKSVAEARKEFKSGKLRPTTPAEVMLKFIYAQKHKASIIGEVVKGKSNVKVE